MNSLNVPLDLALKSVSVLALVTLSMPLLRRGSAALRHLVWLLALMGLLALPFLSAALPGWNLLPRWNSSATQPTGSPQAHRTAEVTEYSLGQAMVQTSVERHAPAAPSVKGAARVSLAAWVWTVWLGGMLLALTPLVLALLSLRRLERRAAVITDDSWLDLLENSQRRLQMNQSVTLLKSSERQMPMTWGALRPRLLLPAEAEVWPAQRRELALLHELAHVKRGDSVVNYIAHAVCALYWFNPLVWLAARRLRAEREQACDDLVLRSGLDAGDYADELLDLATTLNAAPFATVAASPMARRSTLEERLLAILDRERNRAALTAPKIVGAVALLAAILIPISMLRAEAAETQTTSQSPAPSTSASGDEQDIVKSYAVESGGTLTMKVDEGDIEVKSAEGNKVEVTVHRRVTHASDAEATALLKEHQITFEQNGSDVTIDSEGPASRSSSWFHPAPSLQVDYQITTPLKYNFNLATGGGTIRIDHVEGKVQTKTSGGNLEATRIDGPVSAHTDGGNVIVSDCQTLDAESGGGNLQLSRLSGTVVARTSGGNAKVDDCAGALDLKSGGGNFTIDKFTGPSLRADTGGGSISADLVNPPTERCSFKSGGGNIRLKVPDSVAVNLDASTGGGTVSCELPVTTPGAKSDDSLKGTINGGGPELKVTTGGGNIKISKR
jgi:beta-lactamase regulating signal transducer with metallopeptidase domain/DUF4097 and DUF4098 domain-containing protein YvlB